MHDHPYTPSYMTFFQTFVSLIAKNKSTPFTTTAIGLNNTFTAPYMQRERQIDSQIEHFQCSQDSNLSLIPHVHLNQMELRDWETCPLPCANKSHFWDKQLTHGIRIKNTTVIEYFWHCACEWSITVCCVCGRRSQGLIEAAAANGRQCMNIALKNSGRAHPGRDTERA